MPDKSTVVIGGLISDTTTRNTSGVPWLSDIPLLGYLFKDTTKSKERDELIIMIQPSVIETEADQIAVNEEEKQRTLLGREAVGATTGVAPAALTPQTDTSEVTIRSVSYSSKNGPSTTTPTGPVSASSSPAPDVGNDQAPKITSPAPTTP